MPGQKDDEAIIESGENTQTRRDWLLISTLTLATAGTAVGLWPFIKSLNPSAEIQAQRTSKIDISGVELGEQLVAQWQGKPLFIVHRTKEMIEKAEADDGGIDPQADSERVERPEWLILLGTCPHLGCVPRFEETDEYLWVCPCHNSTFDYSGRVLRTPSPKNLQVPPYRFISDTEVEVGEA